MTAAERRIKENYILSELMHCARGAVTYINGKKCAVIVPPENVRNATNEEIKFYFSQFVKNKLSRRRI